MDGLSVCFHGWARREGLVLHLHASACIESSVAENLLLSDCIKSSECVRMCLHVSRAQNVSAFVSLCEKLSVCMNVSSRIEEFHRASAQTVSSCV